MPDVSDTEWSRWQSGAITYRLGPGGPIACPYCAAQHELAHAEILAERSDSDHDRERWGRVASAQSTRLDGLQSCKCGREVTMNERRSTARAQQDEEIRLHDRPSERLQGTRPEINRRGTPKSTRLAVALLILFLLASWGFATKTAHAIGAIPGVIVFIALGTASGLGAMWLMRNRGD